MRHLTLALALALPGFTVGLTLACHCDDNPSGRCLDLPEGDLIGFDVTVGTGRDGSDADIFFCVARVSNETPLCAQMATTADDDFMKGEVETYQVSIEVGDGDLDRFWVENRGGAFLRNNEWELASIRVAAILEDGEAFQIYEEPDVCAKDLEAGDAFHPKACEYG